MADEKYTNRLIRETSPYLRQHAHNPVDWHPWGEEAFSASIQRDKPIFLSIGYSTCHWCHVMERESFSDEQVASFLNTHFVCIKLDREEYPEIDAQYMEFAQSLLRCPPGWPLNLFLTPEKKPFFALTYLPPKPKLGLSGFLDILRTIKEYWNGEERERLEMQAAQIVQAFSAQVRSSGSVVSEKPVLQTSVEVILKLADPIFGGLGGEPKFPAPHQYLLLLRHSVQEEDSRSGFFVLRTLDRICQGGVYDQLAGGFCRYSVDEKWMIPHFEKMLFDNVFLTECYLEAYIATKLDRYKRVCLQTIQYLADKFYQPHRGFSTAMDAESEGEEGKYYTWTVEEIRSILGAEAKQFVSFYRLNENPNFRGSFVLYQDKSPEQFARDNEISVENFLSYLNRCHTKLLVERNKRTEPFLDKKILVSGNGAAIHLFALAAKIDQNSSLLTIAENACNFILDTVRKRDALFHSWMDDKTTAAIFDDYAHMIRALITLFEATSNLRYLHWARHFTTTLEMEFKQEGGAFYQTGEEADTLLRRCTFADGSEPSANSVHCQNLLRLYQLTFDESYLTQATDILRAAEAMIGSYPPGYAFALMNLYHYYDVLAPSFVVVLNKEKDHKQELEKILWRSFIPHKVVLFIEEDNYGIFKYLPFFAQYTPKSGETALYICQKGVCQRPITQISEMKKRVQSLEKKIIHE